MLIVAFIFSLTNPLDAKLVKMSDVFTEAFAYGVGLCISFYLLARSQKRGFRCRGAGQREMDRRWRGCWTPCRCCFNWHLRVHSRW